MRPWPGYATLALAWLCDLGLALKLSCLHLQSPVGCRSVCGSRCRCAPVLLVLLRSSATCYMPVSKALLLLFLLLLTSHATHGNVYDVGCTHARTLPKYAFYACSVTKASKVGCAWQQDLRLEAYQRIFAKAAQVDLCCISRYRRRKCKPNL